MQTCLQRSSFHHLLVETVFFIIDMAHMAPQLHVQPSGHSQSAKDATIVASAVSSLNTSPSARMNVAISDVSITDKQGHISPKGVESSGSSMTRKHVPPTKHSSMASLGTNNPMSPLGGPQASILAGPTSPHGQLGSHTEGTRELGRKRWVKRASVQSWGGQEQ